MQRPVKKFDFLLQDTWEYCLKHCWLAILSSAAVCILIGVKLNDYLRPGGFYEGYNDYMMNHGGVTFGEATTFLVLFIFVFLPLLRIAYKFSKWSMDRQNIAFVILAMECKEEYNTMMKEEIPYDKNLLLEYHLYKGVMTANDIIWRNKMMNEDARQLEADKKTLLATIRESARREKKAEEKRKRSDD